MKSAASGLPEAIVDQVTQDPTAIHNELQKQLTPEQLDTIRDGYLRGFQTTWITCAALGAVATICSFVLQPKPLDRGDEAEQKERSKKWLAERKAKKHGDKDVSAAEEGRGNQS